MEEIKITYKNLLTDCKIGIYYYVTRGITKRRKKLLLFNNYR